MPCSNQTDQHGQTEHGILTRGHSLIELTYKHSAPKSLKMSINQEIDETLHTEVEIKPTLDERALIAIGRPLSKEETNRLYAKILKSSEKIKGRFVCLVCAYSSRKFNVRAHIRSDTGERPYQCNFCTKKFKTKVDCNRHIRTHIRDKPYQCKILP